MSRCRDGTVLNETYTATVRFPKPLTTRITETWEQCRSCCLCIFGIFIFLSFAFIAYGLVFVMSFCHQDPGMALESLSIRDMTVYQNTTTGTSQWQVDSAFNVTLSTWNPNTVAGCFATYRRVIMRVEYRSQTILQQEVPLGFGLKPQQSRPVAIELQGEQFQLKKPDLGPVMETDLQSGIITLDIYFDTRYLRNDRKAGWLNYGCVVEATTPSNSASHMLNKLCYST